MSIAGIRRRRVGVSAKAVPAEQRAEAPGDPLFKGVQWSPAYIAFIVYVFTITTYRLPLGTASMVTALVLLPLERRPLRLPSPLLWMIAFLGWSFVGWGSSPYPNVVWDAVTELAKICGVMLVAVNVLNTRQRVRFFVLAFLGFFAFYPVRGSLFAYFIYGGTVEGRAAWNYTYSNPNDLAALCILPLALAAGLLLTERTRWVKVCAAAGAVALPFVILLTQSRGAFIALGIFAFAVLKGQKERRGKILLVGAGLAIVVALAAPSSMWKRFGTISDVTNEQSAAKAADEGSARQRMELWHVAATIAQENPVSGVGFGAYHDAHFEYAQRPNFDPMALGHRDAHSTYLTLLAETGIVGFLLFAGLICSIVSDAERTRRRARSLLPARAAQIYFMELGLLGYFIAGIWGSYQAMVLTYLYLAVFYSTVQVVKSELVPEHAVTRGRAIGAAMAMRIGRRQVAR